MDRMEEGFTTAWNQGWWKVSRMKKRKRKSTYDEFKEEIDAIKMGSEQCGQYGVWTRNGPLCQTAHLGTELEGDLGTEESRR